MKSKLGTVNIILGSIAAVALTIVGVCVDPKSPLPTHTAFYASLIAGICGAIKACLVQATDASDEAQGIAPAQVAMAQAIHDQAKAPPTITTDPTTGSVTLVPAAQPTIVIPPIVPPVAKQSTTSI